ncbi:hypothetical protein HDU83_003021 [Entophlyctis luteolus]|nr:hypothetical protein HDU83_003021 [Entophlyctis luteolus]
MSQTGTFAGAGKSGSGGPGSTGSGTSIGGDREARGGDKEAKDIENTRHVSAILAHFTTSPEALGRLAQEKHELLVVLSYSEPLSVVFVSPSCVQILGCPPASLRSKPLDSLLHPEDAEAILKLVDTSKHQPDQQRAYCRFLRLDRNDETCVFLDVTVERISTSESDYALITGRVYAPSLIDQIQSLRVLNLQLQSRLPSAPSATSAAAGIEQTISPSDLAAKSMAAIELLQTLSSSTQTAPLPIPVTPDIALPKPKRRAVFPSNPHEEWLNLLDAGEPLPPQLSSFSFTPTDIITAHQFQMHQHQRPVPPLDALGLPVSLFGVSPQPPGSNTDNSMANNVQSDVNSPTLTPSTSATVRANSRPSSSKKPKVGCFAILCDFN